MGKRGREMNRQIKFRGQRTDTKEWVYGNLNIHETGSMYYIGNGDSFKTPACNILGGNITSFYATEVIPETIGQYTGLKDETGKDIYEGDIVKSEGISDVVYGIIVFGKIKVSYTTAGGHQGFYIDWQNNAENKRGCWWRKDIYNFVNEVEVIGNIHSNPELLEVQNGD